MTARFTPPAVIPSAPRSEDPRVGHLLGRDIGPHCAPRVVLLGFPTDQGVKRNGGRPGAAGAPPAIRRALYQLTPDARDDVRDDAGDDAPPDAQGADPLDDLLAATEDRGDLVVTGDLEADQDRLGQEVAAILDAGAFPVVLGGGHETAFGHFLGYVRARWSTATPDARVTLLNFDAHADVREPVAAGGHSGSPFRQALLHPSGLADRYLVAGLLPWSVSRAHLAFVRARGQALFREQLSVEALPRLFDSLGPGPVLASFDIDAVDGALAPGVSAPAAGGLGSDLWLAAAYQAGRCAAVTSFDLVETNPAVDRDGQTARLAAVTVWMLLRGLADRPPA